MKWWELSHAMSELRWLQSGLHHLGNSFPLDDFHRISLPTSVDPLENNKQVGTQRRNGSPIRYMWLYLERVSVTKLHTIRVTRSLEPELRDRQGVISSS